MALVVPQEAERNLLNIITNKASSSNLRLHLYESPITAPDETTALVSITEATGSGYDGPKDMPPANWSVSTDGGGDSEAEHDPIVFNYTGSKSVYGYFVTDNADNYLLWVEEFAGAPFVLPAGGGTITITSKVQVD